MLLSVRDLKVGWQEPRSRQPVRVVHLDVEPVGIGPVVRQVEASVVDVNPSESAEVSSGVVDLDSVGLSVLKVEDADLERQPVHVTSVEYVMDRPPLPVS